ncbi:MAG: tyrosine-type recombinase/integrase [Eubacteriales bacterium]|nr:tyrosine-type recombinase/integrase [Eubacteriales bacterium]
MICIKCKKEIPDNSVYCNYCGKKQVITQSKRSHGNGLGTVFKDCNSWTAEYTFDFSVDENGKIKRNRKRKRGFKTKKDGLKYLENISGIDASNKIIDIWQNVKNNLYAKLTLANQRKYDLAFERIKKIHNKYVTDINANSLQRILDSYTHYQSKAIKTVLNEIYTNALINKQIENNFISYLKLPKAPAPKKSDAFSVDEVQTLWQLWNANNDKFIGATLIMIYTGLMPKELLSITVNMIDYNSNTIIGCNSSKTIIREESTIIFPDIIKPLLITLSAGLDASDKLINVGRKHLYDKIIKIINTYGFNKNLTPYSCRKTTATALAVAGIQPAIISKIMRHSKYETTLKYYTKPQLDELIKSLNKI